MKPLRRRKLKLKAYQISTYYPCHHCSFPSRPNLSPITVRNKEKRRKIHTTRDFIEFIEIFRRKWETTVNNILKKEYVHGELKWMVKILADCSIRFKFHYIFMEISIFFCFVVLQVLPLLSNSPGERLMFSASYNWNENKVTGDGNDKKNHTVHFYCGLVLTEEG